MTTTDQPLDLDAIRERHKVFTNTWGLVSMAPDGPINAALSAADVPALLAEVQRLQAVADAAVEWRAQFGAPEGLAPVVWPQRAALIAAVDDLTAHRTGTAGHG